ncbi:MAG TPA: 4,5-DOPA dioxygenase extradiol [Spirochaetota bacterium]
MTSRFPSLFIGHGSPMNIILDNDFTRSLGLLGKSLPRPSAILVISAHWLTDHTFVSVNAKPRQIYDFYGFPEELYQIKYEPAGSPELAQEISFLTKGLVQVSDSWGLDHAAWAVLHHIYPEADIPVIELSLNLRAQSDYHKLLGKKLSILRNKGILIISSGNIVHNLSMIDFDSNATPYPWALSFDQSIQSIIDTKDFTSLYDYKKLHHASMAIPTPDHFIPLLYFLADIEPDDKIEIVHEGIQNGSVSMRTLISY